MNTDAKPPVHPACNLQVGTAIKLAGSEMTIRHVNRRDDWITLTFDKQWWNPLTEKWSWSYGCHFGFCFEVIERRS